MAINRLRQQQLFDQFDITNGGIMGGGMGYEEDPYQTAPQMPQQAPVMRTPELPQQQRPMAPLLQQSQQELRMPTPTYGLPGQQQPPVETDIQGLIDMANRFYTPQTRASDRFNNLLDEFPQREEPGLGTRLIGATAFLGNKSRGIPGGYEIQDKVMNAPFYRDVAAWKEKTGPFQQGAQIENTANNTERQLASNMVTGAVNTRRYDDQQRIAQAKQDEIGRSNLVKEEIQRQKIEIDRAARLGAKFSTKGERIIAMFPDGHTEDAGPTTNFSPLELENLRQSGRMDVVRQQGANSLANVQAGGWILVQDADGNQYRINPRQQGQAQPISPNAPPQPTGPVQRIGTEGGSGGFDEDDPTKYVNARKGRIMKALDQNPTWSRFIKDGDMTNLQIVDPPRGGGLFSGTNAAEKQDYDKFMKAVAGTNYVSPYLPQTNSQGESSAGYTSTQGTSRGSDMQSKNQDVVQVNPPQVQYKYDQSPSTGIIRRTTDGKTYEYSSDGGRTWKK